MTAASARADAHERVARIPAALNGRAVSTTVWPSRWSWSVARAHAVVVSVLTQAEILIAARRLAGARPHLAAVAGIVHHEDLWQLCVRHEALLLPDGGERPPLPCRRSGGVKLEAA